MNPSSLILVALGYFLCPIAFADTPIPPDSKARWDFRGPPGTISRDSFTNLFETKTYEELRDSLIIAIEDLEHEPDDPTPLYVASDCRLALIRTYYLLGDYMNADRLLNQYSIVHQDADGRFDLSREPIRPLPITKLPEDTPKSPAAEAKEVGEQDGGGQHGGGQPDACPKSK